MTDHYAQLTDGEKCYWNVYTRLRELSDWPAFTDGQDDAKADARAWLVARRKEIWRSAQPEADGGDGKGWDHANRRERYAQLADDSLNSGSPHELCQLPTGGGTDTEKVKISEREMWWNQASVDDQTQAWRDNCTGWLIDRRKKVWHLGEDDGWNTSQPPVPLRRAMRRHQDGPALRRVAGQPRRHDRRRQPRPGRRIEPGRRPSSSCRSYLGVNENPPGVQPRDAPDRRAGRTASTATTASPGAPASAPAWPGTPAPTALELGRRPIHRQHGPATARGMFRGWTTDPAEVLQGDMAIISCTTCHIGLVVDSDDPWHTIEGNTSPGDEGSPIQRRVRRRTPPLAAARSSAGRWSTTHDRTRPV